MNGEAREQHKATTPHINAGNTQISTISPKMDSYTTRGEIVENTASIRGFAKIPVWALEISFKNDSK